MSDPYKFLSGLGQTHLIKCISILLDNDEEMLRFLFSHKDRALRCASKNLIEEASTFPIGEQLKVRVALDFWNRRGAARFADLLTEWENEDWIRFICAIIEFFEITDDVITQIEKQHEK